MAAKLFSYPKVNNAGKIAYFTAVQDFFLRNMPPPVNAGSAA